MRMPEVLVGHDQYYPFITPTYEIVSCRLCLLVQFFGSEIPIFINNSSVMSIITEVQQISKSNGNDIDAKCMPF